MTNTATLAPTHAAGDLTNQTVVVLGGSSGIGLATAHRARSAGARLVLTGRNAERLDRASQEVAAVTTAILELGQTQEYDEFFAALPGPIDHVLVTGGGPLYSPIAQMAVDQARAVLEEHVLGSLLIARACAARIRPGGSLTFITGTSARRPGVGRSIAAIAAAAVPVIAANVAVELAPMRANVIAAGFVDTPLSARILGDQLEERRAHLRATLPIRRVVGPDDVAALAVHLMTNTAVTGATFDVDGGEQLLPS